MPRWVESGHVMYNTPEGNLMALPVDSKRLTATGAPILVQDGVRIFPSGVGLWSVAINGTIVLGLGRTPQSRLVIVDRNGRITALSDHQRGFRLPRVSPEGNRIGIQIATSGTNVDSDIWLFDRQTGALSRFTATGGNSDPIWTPDGKRIVFAGREHPKPRRSLVATSGTSTGRMWTEPHLLELIYGACVGSQYPWSITPDSKTLVIDASAQPSKIVSMTIGSPEFGARRCPQHVHESNPEALARRKMAGSRLNGTSGPEVYVRPFPGPGRAEQVSINGGDQPVWSHDGRELFFRDGVSLVSARMEGGLATSRAVLFEDLVRHVQRH